MGREEKYDASCSPIDGRYGGDSLKDVQILQDVEEAIMIEKKSSHRASATVIHSRIAALLIHGFHLLFGLRAHRKTGNGH